jgi:hypothetical protein
MHSIDEPSIIFFDQIQDIRGNLCFFENSHNIPFLIYNVTLINNINEYKGIHGYSFTTKREIIINLSGEIEIILIDKQNNIIKYTLNQPNMGIYIPSNYWRSVNKLNHDNLILIISDSPETDIIDDFSVFIS